MTIHILEDRRVHEFLLRADQDLAAERRELGCGECGAALHCSNFPRKPRGCAAHFKEIYSQRLSFDCSICDKRATPASVRFIGHRSYVATVLAVVCPRGPASRSALCRQLSVPAATVKRWRQWWNETFVLTRLWSSKRAFFDSPVNVSLLPGSAIERFAGELHEKVVRFLHLLLPIETRVLPV